MNEKLNMWAQLAIALISLLLTFVPFYFSAKKSKNEKVKEEMGRAEDFADKVIYPIYKTMSPYLYKWNGNNKEFERAISNAYEIVKRNIPISTFVLLAAFDKYYSVNKDKQNNNKEKKKCFNKLSNEIINMYNNTNRALKLPIITLSYKKQNGYYTSKISLILSYISLSTKVIYTLILSLLSSIVVYAITSKALFAISNWLTS